MRAEEIAEYQRSVLAPTDFFPDPQGAVETPAETDRISEPLSNRGEDGNETGLSGPPISVSAEPPGATGETQGANSKEPASMSEGAGEKPGDVGRLDESGSNGGEHDEHENGAEMTVRLSSPEVPSESDTAREPESLGPNAAEAGARVPGAGTGKLTDSSLNGHDHNERGENRGDFGLDAEALRREEREDRDLRESIRYDVMHPGEDELGEENLKQLDQESKLDRPKSDDVGEQPNWDDRDDRGRKS